MDKLAAHGPLLVVVDQPTTIGALPVAVLRWIKLGGIEVVDDGNGCNALIRENAVYATCFTRLATG